MLAFAEHEPTRVVGSGHTTDRRLALVEILAWALAARLIVLLVAGIVQAVNWRPGAVINPYSGGPFALLGA